MKEPSSGSPEILAFLYLVQDLDVLLPILKSLKAVKANFAAFVSPLLIAESPRVQAALENDRIPWITSSLLEFKLRLAPRLRGVRALITAADTTAHAHRPAHFLVKRANRAGIETFTLQHGLENIGLTYFDDEFPVDGVEFASKTIFIWGGEDSLHPDVPDRIRRKCVSVGCPKEFDPKTVPEIRFKHTGSRLVVVFENLHWSRYSDEYRERFLSDLESAALSNPEVTLLVKPHHAGRWLTERYRGDLPRLSNLIIANPKDPCWEPFTAPALIKIADAVITTPSTTVFDAASINRPVAIVGYDLPLPVYEPLPILRGSGDWARFMQTVSSPLELEKSHLAIRIFHNRYTKTGQPALRIAKHIVQQVEGIPAAAAAFQPELAAEVLSRSEASV